MNQYSGEPKIIMNKNSGEPKIIVNENSGAVGRRITPGYRQGDRTIQEQGTIQYKIKRIKRFKLAGWRKRSDWPSQLVVEGSDCRLTIKEAGGRLTARQQTRRKA